MGCLLEKGQKKGQRRRQTGGKKGTKCGQKFVPRDKRTRVPEEKEMGGGKGLPFIMEHNECGQWAF